MGEVFAGRYELIDPIASGGMGTVWRVLDRTDGEVKAAKMLRQADAAMLLRFVREQSMRISHTHVVTPQSWAGVDDRVLFTMPLVRGGAVAGLLKRYGALPPRWIGPLVDQTLQALEAVHAAGIVHRDIKPGNLLLEPTGRNRPHLRLTDFGIAVPSDEPRLTHVAMVIGTPGYMPPEQIVGADPHPSADIYALGMVTREMLTGRRPTSDVAAGGVPTEGLRSGDRDRDLVVDVIEAATTADPERRPTAAQLRQHPSLRALLELPESADDIEIGDEYADLPLPDPPTAPMSAAATIPPPPPPPPARQAAGSAPTAPPSAPPSGHSWTLPPPRATSVLPPRPTRSETAPQAAGGPWPTADSARRRTPVSAFVLLLVGLVGLVVAAWLLLG